MFILCCAMMVGGLYGILFELIYARIIFFRLVIGGGLLAGVGSYLIWTDFIAPRFGIKTWED